MKWHNMGCTKWGGPTPPRLHESSEQKALDELAEADRSARNTTTSFGTAFSKRCGATVMSEASVLLELAQNADDALAQAAEIKGAGLPPSACSLVIDVLGEGDAHIIDVTHYGRPINETGGSAFPCREGTSVGSRPVLHDAHELERQAG